MNNVIVANENIPADSQTYRAKIGRLVAAMEQEPQLDLPLRHFFANGTYTRELHIPAGTIAVGRIHRYSCTNILTVGRLVIFTDELEQEIAAPFTFVSNPGLQKAVAALEDSVFVTVHPWEGPPDVDRVLDIFTAPTYEALTHQEDEE